MENQNKKPRPADSEAMLQNIESVQTSTASYFKKYLKEHLFLSVIFILLVAALALFSPNLFLAAIFFIIVAVYSFFYKNAQHIFMEQIAEKLKYGYSRIGNLDELTGNLFRIGHSQRMEDVISGKYQNLPIRIFNYYFSIGYGKYRRNYQHTVFEIKLDTLLPNIVLLRKQRFLSFLNNVDIKPLIGSKEKISLEGNFDNYFSLYVPEDFEIEALQIFTPDIMADFIDKFQALNMEILGDKMYVYFGQTITTKKELLSAYDFIADFSTKLTEVLRDVGEHLTDEDIKKYL